MGMVYKPEVLVMETGVSPVQPGLNKAGWVSGDPAGLAASAAVTVVFDLGPDWAQYGLAQLIPLPVGPSSGFTGFQAYGSDTTTFNGRRRLGQAFSTGTSGIFAAVPTASGPAMIIVRPVGRYLVITATNGDATNALGVTASVTLSVYPS